MGATFVMILTFRVLHFCQAQSDENFALTKADTGALGTENRYKSMMIGGHNSTYAP